MTESPRVAVCIPAYDEVDEVAATVKSVVDCDYPSSQVQVVVCVDGGDPRVMAAAERAGATAIALQPNRGSYAARNAAVATLDGSEEFVLFTDTGCRASAQWIREHVRALQETDLSGGGIRFAFAGPTPTPSEWVDSIRHLKQESYVASGFAVTANLGVRRSVLDAQRFDDSLRSGGDADFCRRATAAGFTLAYASAAEVAHPARNRREFVAKVRRLAGAVPGDQWVGREYPRPPLNLSPYRRAQAAGIDPGLRWGVTATVLNAWAQMRIRRATQRAAKAHSERAS